ncbi:MAG: hypothetical protein KGJ78_11165 [Alphaproteobacteria bacterium]|nr:hypothetical protein [Alphaproteobacteria bacterium]
MVDQALLPAIRETIRQNEIGGQSPYLLSFAKLGKSGASFGFMQGDTNVSALARTTLQQVLAAAGTDPGAISRILEAVSRPLPGGNPLTSSDTDLVNAALNSEAGRPLVDAMDNTLFQVVLDGVDSCIRAGATRGVEISPIAHLYIAPWVNMSGPPTLLCTWLKGSQVFGLPIPTPPWLTEANMQAYLQATAYFQAHPRNFVHLEECIAKGAALLPH